MLQQTIWPRNHTSHTKDYCNEFVANVLCDNISIVKFDLRGYGGYRGQKRPMEATNGMRELINGKKILIKVSQQPQKILKGSDQI